METLCDLLERADVELSMALGHLSEDAGSEEIAAHIHALQDEIADALYRVRLGLTL